MVAGALHPLPDPFREFHQHPRQDAGEPVGDADLRSLRRYVRAALPHPAAGIKDGPRGQRRWGPHPGGDIALPALRLGPAQRGLPAPRARSPRGRDRDGHNKTRRPPGAGARDRDTVLHPAARGALCGPDPLALCGGCSGRGGDHRLCERDARDPDRGGPLEPRSYRGTGSADGEHRRGGDVRWNLFNRDHRGAAGVRGIDRL